ncbi:MAG TPA: DnaJ domain-containing protein [Phycisphaerales bacterium]|nr:DnaJ domain-containing protein [Phycisphaerales bacterium]
MLNFDWLKPRRPATDHRQRGAERRFVQGLSCPALGDVVDLSVSGLRATSKRRPGAKKGEAVPLVITNEAQTIRLNGVVAWVRRSGEAWQVGVRFVDVRPGVAAALDQFSRYGFISTDEINDASQKRAAYEARATDEGAAGQNVHRPGAMKLDVENIYEALGLPAGAAPEQIRVAYHRLAMELHPDRNPGPDAHERFARISKAYQILRDPERRKRYDALLRGEAA